MKSQILMFQRPYQVETVEQEILGPGEGEVTVKALCSAISAGSELLFYRGQVPTDLCIDEKIPHLNEAVRYPLQYGYSSVGEVLGTHQRVFAFQPHQSLYVCKTSEMLAIPDVIETEDAALFPNLETATSLVMDASPVIGEAACIIGQGSVGLLTTAVLAEMYLERLVTVDRFEARRQLSSQFGATATFSPDTVPKELVSKFDLVIEVSGNPDALGLAIALAGYGGRIIVGSWYGNKKGSFDFGGRFHRLKQKITSSQVSFISPKFCARWDKERRYRLAWKLMERVRPSRIISHRFSIAQSAQAFALLDQNVPELTQAIFEY